MSDTNSRILEIKTNIQKAKKMGALQVGKKIELAESAIDGAIEIISDLEYRLENVETVLKMCNLDELINGVDNGG